MSKTLGELMVEEAVRERKVATIVSIVRFLCLVAVTMALVVIAVKL